MPEENHFYLEIACSHSDAWLYGLMVWNMSFVLVCSILAALTRKLPENYNESKFITFCAFCSLVVFLAFQSTVLVISHEHAYNIAGYEALGLIVNATVVLFSLFIVKLYAAYFVAIENWNVRRRSSVAGSVSSSSHRHSKGISNSGYVGDSLNDAGISASSNGQVRANWRSMDDHSVHINSYVNNNSVFEAPDESNNVDSKVENSVGPREEYDSKLLKMEESTPNQSTSTEHHSKRYRPKSVEASSVSELSTGVRAQERRCSSLEGLNDSYYERRRPVDYDRSISTNSLSIRSIHDLPDQVHISPAENV